jgi:hypothetical protein
MITMMHTVALAPAGTSGTEAFLALIQLVSDPDAAKERLGKIFDACMEANDKIREANEAQQIMSVERKLHDETLLRERTEHDRSIAEAKKKSDFDCGAAMAEARLQRASAAKLEAQAKADATAAAELKANLEQRIAKIKSAAAD